MHGIERDGFPIKTEPGDELARGGDFVAFVLGELAAEAVPGGGGDGGEGVAAAGVFGLLAIAGHRFVRWGGTADAALPLDEDFFDEAGVHVGHHAAEGGRGGRGAAAGPGVATRAGGLELRLREAFCEDLGVLLSARRVCQVGGGHDA